MQIDRWLPFASMLVTAIFAAAVLRRYVRRRRPYLLFWGLGLVFYGLGAFAEFYSTLAWSPLVFRLWYIGGALLTAAWLGQGTVFLLVRRGRIAFYLMVLLLIGSALAVIVMFNTPLNAEAFSPDRPLSVQYKTDREAGIVGILPEGALVRKLTPIFNLYGTVALVGGAIYSSWIFWRKRILPNRMIGNILIAVGALSPAFGGTLSRLGMPEFLYISELLGAVLMFIGFLQATAVPEAAPSPRPSRA